MAKRWTTCDFDSLAIYTIFPHRISIDFFDSILFHRNLLAEMKLFDNWMNKLSNNFLHEHDIFNNHEQMHLNIQLK